LFQIVEVFRIMKYADPLVLLTKEETVLQGMTDRLTEIEWWYGMEINVEKTKVMRISRQLCPVQTMTDQKQLENVEYFNYLGNITTNVRLNPGLPW
jgi:hypothetical protein